MNAKNRKLLFLLLFSIAMLLPAHTVFADVGPKPSMEFEFKGLSEGEITIVSGALYECSQSDCSDAAPLGELGPQGFKCNENSCNAMAYGFAPFHRLEIQFSDGRMRQSNIFETVDFYSNYLVTVNPDDLSVEAVSGSPAPSPEPFPEAPSPMPRVIIGVSAILCIGLVFLLSIGLVIFFVRRQRTK